MNCSLCDEPIETTHKKIEMHCCDLVLHTKCCFDRLTHSLLCLCGQDLFPYQHIEAQNEVIPDTPEYNNKLKALKTQINQYKKLVSSFNRKIKEESLNFKELSLDLINQLTALKKNYVDLLENSDEYKNLSKQRRKAKTLLTRFQNEYNISRSYIVQTIFKDRTLYFELCHNGINWKIRKQFRIGL